MDDGFLNFDHFVAAVAAGIGLCCLWAACSNQAWFYELKKARWLSEKWGRPAARGAYLAISLLLLVLATLILFGFRVDWG